MKRTSLKLMVTHTDQWKEKPNTNLKWITTDDGR